jgi:predicted lipid-binding transport protein (Tim44 family)
MKSIFLKSSVFALSFAFLSVGHIAVVDAKRLGGGSNVGRSANAPVQKQAQPPAQQKPAQQAQQPAATTPPQAAAPAAAKRSGFGGMLGGLAAGLGIAYLLSHFGLGEAAASFMTGLLLAVLVGFALLFVLRRFMPAGAKNTPSPVPASNGMQKTAVQEPVFAPSHPVNAGFGSPSPVIEEAPAYQLPEGFDQIAFLANAKHYFTRLQKAWDAGDLEALREFTTPEMFASLQRDLQGRAEGVNHTDVVTLNAELLGVETDANTYLCSVEFSGLIREQAEGPAEPFREVWNLSKPVNGPGGWVLAGIQQLV